MTRTVSFEKWKGLSPGHVAWIPLFPRPFRETNYGLNTVPETLTQNIVTNLL